MHHSDAAIAEKFADLPVRQEFAQLTPLGSVSPYEEDVVPEQEQQHPKLYITIGNEESINAQDLGPLVRELVAKALGRMDVGHLRETVE